MAVTGSIMTEEAGTSHSTLAFAPPTAGPSPLSEAAVRGLIREEVAVAVAAALATRPGEQHEIGYTSKAAYPRYLLAGL